MNGWCCHPEPNSSCLRRRCPDERGAARYAHVHPRLCLRCDATCSGCACRHLQTTVLITACCRRQGLPSRHSPKLNAQVWLPSGVLGNVLPTACLTCCPAGLTWSCSASSEAAECSESTGGFRLLANTARLILSSRQLLTQHLQVLHASPGCNLAEDPHQPPSWLRCPALIWLPLRLDRPIPLRHGKSLRGASAGKQPDQMPHTLSRAAEHLLQSLLRLNSILRVEPPA